MRYSITFAVTLAALSIGEVVAGPTHAHLHRHVHQKKDVDWDALDWKDMDVDWAAAYAAGQNTPAAAAAPAATPAPAAAPAAAASVAAPAAKAVTPAVKDVSTSNSAAGALFEGLVGAANGLTAFGSPSSSSGSTGDFYYGNVGVPYGSNVIKVGSRAGYDFTNEFINTSGESITVVVWNKVGSDGQPLSGSALASKSGEPALTFALAPGASQIVAFQENSQVGWAQATSQLTASGAFATSWGEANFVSTGSGYDLSAILNPAGNNYNMAITSVEAPACTSDPTQNYWLTASEPIGGSDGSCYIAQSTASLTTKMGGTI